MRQLKELTKLARPKLGNFAGPKSVKDMPFPIAKAGFILEKNAGWRNSKPVINPEKCVNCMQCYLLCPEGTIYKAGEQLAVDYDFCKGCGICEHECRVKAIAMIPEEE